VPITSHVKIQRIGHDENDKPSRYKQDKRDIVEHIIPQKLQERYADLSRWIGIVHDGYGKEEARRRRHRHHWHRTKDTGLCRETALTLAEEFSRIKGEYPGTPRLLVIVVRRTVFSHMGIATTNRVRYKATNSGTNLQADILKVGHHGSATSSSSAFLSKLHPKTSIIEVGAGNSYGHPTSATLDRLAQVGSAVYRTDLNGDIIVTTDGTTYDVKTGLTSSQPVAATAKIVTTQQTVSSQISSGAVCDCSSNRYDCNDFSGHTAAQACYEYCISLGKGDIHKLNSDKDGLACEG